MTLARRVGILRLKALFGLSHTYPRVKSGYPLCLVFCCTLLLCSASNMLGNLVAASVTRALPIQSFFSFPPVQYTFVKSLRLEVTKCDKRVTYLANVALAKRSQHRKGGIVRSDRAYDLNCCRREANTMLTPKQRVQCCTRRMGQSAHGLCASFATYIDLTLHKPSIQPVTTRACLSATDAHLYGSLAQACPRPIRTSRTVSTYLPATDLSDVYNAARFRLINTGMSRLVRISRR